MTQIAQPYRCDGPGCSRLKGEANHWFLMVVQEVPVWTSSNTSVATIAMCLFPWDERLAAIEGQPRIHHLCGEACVQGKVSEYIGKVAKAA